MICIKSATGVMDPESPSSSSLQTEAKPFPDTRTHYLTPREASRLSKQSQTAHPPRDLSFRQAFAKPSRYLLANASLPSISSPHLQRCSRGQNSPNTPPRHICSSTAWCARRGCCQVHDRTAHRRSLLRMCTSTPSHSISSGRRRSWRPAVCILGPHQSTPVEAWIIY